jgi:hypothetical protein
LSRYVNYPYNYIEPPWYFDQSDEQQGSVNHHPPRSYLTGKDLQSGSGQDEQEIELPYGIPQEVVSQDRYEFIPLPKMVYENYVPLVATRRIVHRRPANERVQAERSFRSAAHRPSVIDTRLPRVEEMTFKF